MHAREKKRERGGVYLAPSLTGEHVVSKHAGEPHDPLVAVVCQVSDDDLREGLARLHKYTPQVVLILFHLQCVLCVVGKGGGGRELYM